MFKIQEIILILTQNTHKKTRDKKTKHSCGKNIEMPVPAYPFVYAIDCIKPVIVPIHFICSIFFLV